MERENLLGFCLHMFKLCDFGHIASLLWSSIFSSLKPKTWETAASPSSRSNSSQVLLSLSEALQALHVLHLAARPARHTRSRERTPTSSHPVPRCSALLTAGRSFWKSRWSQVSPLFQATWWLPMVLSINARVLAGALQAEVTWTRWPLGPSQPSFPALPWLSKAWLGLRISTRATPARLNILSQRCAFLTSPCHFGLSSVPPAQAFLTTQARPSHPLSYYPGFCLSCFVFGPIAAQTWV